MSGALATLVFFAVTPIFATRAAHLLGSLRANFWRLVIALLVLGAWAHIVGRGVNGAAFPWFVLGGVAGFGLGGIAMFKSLPRIGSTLSTLIVQCVSAVVAAAVEWIWLGTTLTALQLACAAVTLAGVTLGLAPQSLLRPNLTTWRAGVAWALVSALGQGVGAVISRKAFLVAALASERVDPGTAAYQRVIGGVIVAVLVLALTRTQPAATPKSNREALPWVVSNAATGPILGVTCYQWALRSTPAGIVQPIVAAAPLLTIPLAAWVEGTRPRPLYYLGAAMAVAGVAGLLVWH